MKKTLMMILFAGLAASSIASAQPTSSYSDYSFSFVNNTNQELTLLMDSASSHVEDINGIVEHSTVQISPSGEHTVTFRVKGFTSHFKVEFETFSQAGTKLCKFEAQGNGPAGVFTVDNKNDAIACQTSDFTGDESTFTTAGMLG